MRLHNLFKIKLPTDKTDFTDLHGFKIILCCGKKNSESLSFVFLLCRYTLCRCTAVHLYNYTNLKWCVSINTKVYQSFRHLYRRGALLCVYTMYLKLNCPQIKRILLIYTDSKLFMLWQKKCSESLSFFSSLSIYFA